jgi:hypothetical protein
MNGTCHPWLDSSAAGGSSSSGTTHPFTTMGSHYSLISDISELSEFPENDHDIGANGDALLSVAPSADCMPSGDLLNINTCKGTHTRPLERRSKVLARKAEAEQADSKDAEAEPATSGSTSTATTGTQEKDVGPRIPLVDHPRTSR